MFVTVVDNEILKSDISNSWSTCWNVNTINPDKAININTETTIDITVVLYFFLFLFKFLNDISPPTPNILFINFGDLICQEKRPKPFNYWTVYPPLVDIIVSVIIATFLLLI